MSMLSSQANELRDRAKVLRQGNWSDGADDAALMEQAAYTIEQLREKEAAYMDANHEQGMRLIEQDKRIRELGIDNGVGRSNNGVTRWAQLFGTPERAAATVAGMPCGARPCSECPVFEPCDGYKLDGGVVLAEWLRGDAE